MPLRLAPWTVENAPAVASPAKKILSPTGNLMSRLFFDLPGTPPE